MSVGKFNIIYNFTISILVCQEHCSLCDAAYNCTDCVDGFYLDSGNCTGK